LENNILDIERVLSYATASNYRLIYRLRRAESAAVPWNEGFTQSFDKLLKSLLRTRP
jgi:hypothetical protein